MALFKQRTLTAPTMLSVRPDDLKTMRNSKSSMTKAMAPPTAMRPAKRPTWLRSWNRKASSDAASSQPMMRLPYKSRQ